MIRQIQTGEDETSSKTTTFSTFALRMSNMVASYTTRTTNHQNPLNSIFNYMFSKPIS